MSNLFKYYCDLMSQPARALWIAFKLGNTSFEDCPVSLREREQHTAAFKKINRFGKVPCIVDGDFHLSESVAILRYLAAKGQFSSKLYPKDLLERTRVDEFLEWQHLGLRYGCNTYFLKMWLFPMNGLAHPPSEEKSAELRKNMEDSLQVVEKIWLNGSKFVAGNKLTVADLFGACEVEQTRLLKYDVKNKFPKVTDWIARIRDESNPYYDEAHKFIYKKSDVEIK